MKIDDIVRVNLEESGLASINGDGSVQRAKIDDYLGRYKVLLTGCFIKFPLSWRFNWFSCGKYDTILKDINSGLIFFAQEKGCTPVNISECDSFSKYFNKHCELENRIQRLEKLHGVVKVYEI